MIICQRLQYTFLLLVLAASAVHGQQELMLSQMDKVWQFNTINPSFFPENKRIVVGLPTYSADAYHSGTITYKDLIANNNGTRQVDFTQFISKLEPENQASYEHRIETFSAGFRLPGPGKSAFNIGHAMRLSTNSVYSKELVQFMWQGNAQFIGQRIEVAPTTNSFDWHELSAGYSRNIGKLRLGAKVKYLAGISALVTDPNANSVKVFTNPDIYQLELETDYGFHSSSIISTIDTSDLGFNVGTNTLRNRFNTKNGGWAFDLGMEYEISSKLKVYASALDIGASLNWKEASYFKSKGQYSFNGATIPGADIINGADSLDFSAKIDSLNDIFQFQKTETSFKTSVPTRYYAGVVFDLTKRLTIAGSIYYEKNEIETKTALGVSAHFRPVKWLGIGVMYAANDKNATNFGAQLTFKPGPLTFFAASDNLGGAFSPFKSSRVNFRTGVALAL